MSWKLQLMSCVALAAMLGYAPNPIVAEGAGKLRIQVDGSTTVGPIADAFAEYFTKKHNVDIQVTKTGSGTGASSLIDSRCQIANLSRFMKPEEFRDALKTTYRRLGREMPEIKFKGE